ncbi:MAG: phenylalanine--tRNA ligase subunit alpha, partial [Alphaproteobacteria bacterium]|nr:phenylalanine--tRNA ligase subunit alpha [Alphaproteobacteria bacterium]
MSQTDDLGVLKASLTSSIAAAASSTALDDIRVAALGKKGSVTELMKKIASLPPEERKAFGANVNVLKNEVAAAIDERMKILGAEALKERLVKESVDVSLPVRPQNEGRVHPTSQTIDEIVTIFASMGFSVAKGPNIENDLYNFEALNFPQGHPARQMQDTFFMPEQDGMPMVLRTHTSPVQIRTMKKQKPPIRVISPGRTYRCDYDQTHTPM